MQKPPPPSVAKLLRAQHSGGSTKLAAIADVISRVVAAGVPAAATPDATWFQQFRQACEAATVAAGDLEVSVPSLLAAVAEFIAEETGKPRKRLDLLAATVATAHENRTPSVTTTATARSAAAATVSSSAAAATASTRKRGRDNGVASMLAEGGTAAAGTLAAAALALSQRRGQQPPSPQQQQQEVTRPASPHRGLEALGERTGARSPFIRGGRGGAGNATQNSGGLLMMLPPSVFATQQESTTSAASALRPAPPEWTRDSASSVLTSAPVPEPQLLARSVRSHAGVAVSGGAVGLPLPIAMLQQHQQQSTHFQHQQPQQQQQQQHHTDSRSQHHQQFHREYLHHHQNQHAKDGAGPLSVPAYLLWQRRPWDLPHPFASRIVLDRVAVERPQKTAMAQSAPEASALEIHKQSDAAGEGRQNEATQQQQPPTVLALCAAVAAFASTAESGAGPSLVDLWKQRSALGAAASSASPAEADAPGPLLLASPRLTHIAASTFLHDHDAPPRDDGGELLQVERRWVATIVHMGVSHISCACPGYGSASTTGVLAGGDGDAPR